MYRFKVKESMSYTIFLFSLVMCYVDDGIVFT